jgi:hypothetical protein
LTLANSKLTVWKTFSANILPAVEIRNPSVSNWPTFNRSFPGNAFLLFLWSHGVHPASIFPWYPRGLVILPVVNPGFQFWTSLSCFICKYGSPTTVPKSQDGVILPQHFVDLSHANRCQYVGFFKTWIDLKVNVTFLLFEGWVIRMPTPYHNAECVVVVIRWKSGTFLLLRRNKGRGTWDDQNASYGTHSRSSNSLLWMDYFAI